MPRADLHAARNALEPLMTRCAERDVNVKLTSRRSRETAGSRIVTRCIETSTGSTVC